MLDELAAPILYQRFPVTEKTLLSLALHFPIGTSAARTALIEQVREYQPRLSEPGPVSSSLIARRRHRLGLVKTLELVKRTSRLGPALETFLASCDGVVFPNARSVTVRSLGTWPNFCFCCFPPLRLAYSGILERLAHPEEVCYNFPAVEEPPEDVCRWVARPKERHVQPHMPIDLVFDIAWLGPHVAKVTYHDHSAEDGLVAKKNIHHVVHIPLAAGPNPNRRRFCRRAFIQTAIRDKIIRYGPETTFEFVLGSLDDDKWLNMEPKAGSEWDEKHIVRHEDEATSTSMGTLTPGHDTASSTPTGAIEYFYWGHKKERASADLAEEKVATFEIDRCPTPESWDRIKGDADCIALTLAHNHEPCTACGLPIVSEDMGKHPGLPSPIEVSQ